MSTGRPEREEIEVSNIGVDHTVDDDIRLTFYVNAVEGNVIRIVVPIGEALDLARNLVNQATYAAADVLVRVKSGDCARCSNVRLVQEKSKGREMSVRCPDCQPQYEAAISDVFARPRIGGGVS